MKTIINNLLTNYTPAQGYILAGVVMAIVVIGGLVYYKIMDK